MGELEATEFLVDKLRSAKNNSDFFDSMRRGWRLIDGPHFDEAFWNEKVPAAVPASVPSTNESRRLLLRFNETRLAFFLIDRSSTKLFGTKACVMFGESQP